MAPTAESHPREWALFSQIDVDGNGSLDIDEIYAYFADMEEGVANELLQVLDTNNDGQVDFEEFCAGWDMVVVPTVAVAEEEAASMIHELAMEPAASESSEQWLSWNQMTDDERIRRYIHSLKAASEARYAKKASIDRLRRLANPGSTQSSRHMFEDPKLVTGSHFAESEWSRLLRADTIAGGGSRTSSPRRAPNMSDRPARKRMSPVKSSPSKASPKGRRSPSPPQFNVGDGAAARRTAPTTKQSPPRVSPKRQLKRQSPRQPPRQPSPARTASPSRQSPTPQDTASQDGAAPQQQQAKGLQFEDRGLPADVRPEFLHMIISQFCSEQSASSWTALDQRRLLVRCADCGVYTAQQFVHSVRTRATIKNLPAEAHWRGRPFLLNELIQTCSDGEFLVSERAFPGALPCKNTYHVRVAYLTGRGGLETLAAG